MPERFRWALRVLLVAAVVWAVVGFGTLIAQLFQLVEWLQPGARVPVTMTTSFSLPTRVGQNSYGGGPFVQDGTAVTATQVSTVLNDVPLLNRVWMGGAPILWSLTAVIVAVLLGLAIRRLAAGTSFGRDASRPVVIAAAVLAVGSTVAQIVQGAELLGFGAFAWAAPSSMGLSIDRAGGWTFEFAALLAACGLLVIALVLRRGLALQRDVDGLV